MQRQQQFIYAASSPAHISAAGLTWESHTSGATRPNGAVQGGNRLAGTEPLYVGRALAPDGKYHPAKVHIGMTAHYCYEDNEIGGAPRFQILVADGDRVKLDWVKAADGKVPAYAVQAEGDELYVGRHAVDSVSELVIGEVDTRKGECIVVTCLKAFKFREYEVLCAYPHASTST